MENLTEDQKMVIRHDLVEASRKLMGVPYYFGAEWTTLDLIPESLDCSELVEGVFNLLKLKMPDGSQAQFDFTAPTASPKIGDLGFFGRSAKPNQIYHVGMVFDDFYMIEARGFQPEADFEYGKVILRLRAKWAAYSNFAGFRSHPKLL